MEKAVSATPSTTFVQADPNTFRELVQRLTGASEPQQPHPPDDNIANQEAAGAFKLKRSSSSPSSSSSPFKLYERRQCPRPKLQIIKPGSLFKPSAHPVRSPSPSSSSRPAFQPSDSPSSNFSNLSIFDKDNKDSGSGSGSGSSSSSSLDLNREEEERAIKERRFYLHPSPRSKPGNSVAVEPELLTLFPLTSPKKPRT
ncbi:VQ motif-containing protein 31 [Cinnamomum micranthum f. kanehirae]|uniref:VQ motif-containing protein 31 n=1 Tax=Cinnamomum micranthum f. kanehirae TaxID=337451 RepID=A0A443PPL2_9MAGN|nr:VQ motif-containing protein 31 [Cinnamomum micranthum f. kanehirae]